jgi:hypothetical protein
VRWLFIIALVLICLAGCKKKKEPYPSLGLEYYPIQVNYYKIYSVDCLVYNDFTLRVDTYQFQIKDKIESELSTSNSTSKEFRAERYVKPTGQSNWKIQKAWVAEKSNFRVVEQIDNKREVKLVFPVKEGVSWDGNAENTLPKEEYSMVRANDTTIQGKTYREVFRVDQVYETDPLQINTQIAFEHYAPHAGLIYKYERFVKRFTTGIPGDPVVDSGYQKTMRILEYGYD